MTTLAQIKWLPSNNPQTQAMRQFLTELEARQWQSPEQQRQATYQHSATLQI